MKVSMLKNLESQVLTLLELCLEVRAAKKMVHLGSCETLLKGSYLCGLLASCNEKASFSLQSRFQLRHEVRTSERILSKHALSKLLQNLKMLHHFQSQDKLLKPSY